MALRRFLIVLLVGLVALAAVVELAAPSFFEARLEERVRERVPDLAEVRADVDSFPVVTLLLTTGRIRHVTLTLDRLVHQRVTFATVRLSVEGLKLDRDQLIRRREVELRDIESGLLTAELTEEALSELAGAPVELLPGQVAVRVGGTRLSARPEIRGRNLRLAGRRLPALSVSLPGDLANCAPDFEVQSGRIVLSCRIEELPSLLTSPSR